MRNYLSAEDAAALLDAQWNEWANAAKAALGIASLDGADGFTIDDAYDAFHSGESVADFVASVEAAR